MAGAPQTRRGFTGQVTTVVPSVHPSRPAASLGAGVAAPGASVQAHSPPPQPRVDAASATPSLRAARPQHGVPQSFTQQSNLQGPPVHKAGANSIRPGADGERVAAADKPGDNIGGSVMAFLRDAGLEQIATPLLRSGFDDMETLLSIEDADMKDLGIPTCHVVRLRKKLQELQPQRGGNNDDVDTNHPVAVFLEDA
eukprot:CAMPEP_0115417504 /NCGR_PEP_ID=MMETSP0271-20121206/24158_1 /TAXON_ID=71861 /ORGANISM="Scrippsiella trochoidea, Strain CCMP3099" /LENGTH=196 /DNA_ID=CAMNT_0002841893 /DNA_START=50 /DNA_END=636 /DNA_ORIENTATION=+